VVFKISLKGISHPDNFHSAQVVAAAWIGRPKLTDLDTVHPTCSRTGEVFSVTHERQSININMSWRRPWHSFAGNVRNQIYGGPCKPTLHVGFTKIYRCFCKYIVQILGATSRIILIGGFKHEFHFPFHIWDVILPSVAILAQGFLARGPPRNEAC
jgi:hypothetical protein